ncbi:hypothetical protein Tco_1144716 [Tanacetum coccineum]
MAALPICDELHRSVSKVDWEPQFILRCRREISEDVRLTKEINALCMHLTAIVDEREAFADELDMLTGNYVPDKMAEFTKQVQNKDIPNLMKLRILGREFELRAQGKELFIEKLKDNKDRLLDLFNQEVGEDLARVREYRGVVFGLNIGMRRREECIEELKALGDCHDVIETVRFMERLQQDDIEKRDRSLLLMREMERPKVYTMDKRPLITELRYKVDSSEWCDVLTYLCREAADEDRSIATELNRLREEMLIICDNRRNIADELRSVRGIVVVQKAAEFVAETVGYAHGIKISYVAGSTDVKDQLSVFFRREVNEESQKMHDYRRLSDDLRENVRRRDAYIEEFKRLEMYNSSDEVIETIEILKGMQVDDMEKASRLILMAREIQNRVYQIYDFITKLRQ